MVRARREEGSNGGDLGEPRIERQLQRRNWTLDLFAPPFDQSAIGG
jgi:hypothetical protein